MPTIARCLLLGDDSGLAILAVLEILAVPENLENLEHLEFPRLLRKTAFPVLLCARLSLTFEKLGGGSAKQNEKLRFPFCYALAFR